MRDVYSWVPWFRELGKRIVDGGEQHLIDKAKMIAWKDDGSDAGILKYGDKNIDPFSFVYTVASLNKSGKGRNRVYPSVSSAFNCTSSLDVSFDEAFIFPTPPGINTLFHGGEKGDPALLWRLFQDAVIGLDAVKPDEFEQVLNIPNVAIRKLTQTLFLVNPEEFLPIDDQTKFLDFFEKVPKRISLEQYRKLITGVRDAFPGCAPYEINLFSYLQSSDQLRINLKRCFQVSTNVYNDGQDHWEEFKLNSHVYTGGSGDTRKYPLTEAKRGDVVLVRFGRSDGRGVGVVYKNDYREEFHEAHRLHVLWLNKESATLPEMTPMMGFSRAEKVIDSFRRTREYKPTFDLLDRLSRGESSASSVSVETESAEKDIPFNQILYGPPGTGKTWQTRNLSLEIIGKATGDPEENRKTFDDLRFDPQSGAGCITMVTFHQNFAYEDFIEGIRPVIGEQRTLAYEMRSGIFKCLVEAAREREHERFVLIVDEINRGNIAKIFGELITLMEGSRRIGRVDETHVTLPYSGETFGIPANLYVIGTMNTADRSIQLLDTALRRRFDFIEMMPIHDHEGISRDVDGVDCTRLLKAMNERITALLDREHQIGHTYLLEVDTIEKLSDTMRNRMFPLLQEYFFDDWAKIRAVLDSNAFVTVQRVQEFSVDLDMHEEIRDIYGRLPFGDPAWKDPDQYRRIYEEVEVEQSEKP